MPIADQNRIYDGWVSLEAGVDAGRAPTLLEPNQAVSAENMVFRGGHPAARPGWRKLDEDFRNPDHCYELNGDNSLETVTGQEASTAYKHGRFQGAIGFSPHNGDDCLMAMINGRLFKIVPRVSGSIVTEIELDYRNTVNRTIAYMLQADKWLVIQDGQSSAIIYDGATARRANETSVFEDSVPRGGPRTRRTTYITDSDKTEVPVGTIMAYGMGRIVVIVKDRAVAFGDLYGSHDGEDAADSLVRFTERNFLAGGFDAGIPFQQGLATGAVFFPQLDTSTGNGQLMVFAERGASSFFLSLPREVWQTSQFQILALLTTGLRGHRSLSVVNEDLWFRAEDGSRSYRQARSEATGWSHIPLSTNVRQFFDVDTATLLKYCSSIYFDNRIVMTSSPYWNQMRPFHTGAVVVDFDIISSFGTKNRPAWDGHWQKYNSGIKILQVVTGKFKGVTRAFFFGLDANGENQLYEMSTNDKDDFDGHIDWELVFRSFDFTKVTQQGSAFTESELYDGDVWLREIIE